MNMKKIICLILASLLFSNTAFGYGSMNYEDFNEYKSKYRILYGIILAVGGIALAYDGFRTVKVNQSKPEVSLVFSSYWFNTATSGDPYDATGSAQFIIKTAGIIKNTGNVDLRNVEVLVRYITVNSGNHEIISNEHKPNDFGTPITYDGNPFEKPLSNLAVNDSKGWTHTTQYAAAGANPPYGYSNGQTAPYPVDNNTTYPSSKPAKLVDIVDINFDYTKKYKNEMNNPYEGMLGVLLITGGAYLLIDYIVSLKRFDYYMKKNNMDFYVENNAEEFKLMLSKRI